MAQGVREVRELPKWIEACATADYHGDLQIEELKKALSIAWEHIGWQAQNIHQAYHQEETGTWETCQRGVCPSNRYALRRIEELGK